MAVTCPVCESVLAPDEREKPSFDRLSDEAKARLTDENALRAFAERCFRDNPEDMTDEQWDVWCNALPLEEFCAYIGHDWKAENMDALIARFSIGAGSATAPLDQCTSSDRKAD